MAAKAEDAPALPAAAPVDPSDPGADPALRRILVDKGTEEEGEEEEEEEEDGMEETKERETRPREAKRRRTCPAALETTCSSLAAKEGEGGESSRAGRGEFSFSFDTRGSRRSRRRRSSGFSASQWRIWGRVGRRRRRGRIRGSGRRGRCCG